MEDLVEGVFTRYSGEARLQRLRWIIAKATSHLPSAATLRTQAAHAFYEASRHDKNLPRFRELFQSLLANKDGVADSSLLPAGLTYDAAWVEETEAAQRQDRAVLRHRLQSVQSHLHKEAIRAAYLSLAEHEARVGELFEAFNSVSRAKDYCTSRQHTATVCLQIVNLSLLLGNHANAKDFLMRLEHTMGTDTTSKVQQEIQIASGLERLMRQDFARAAHHFAQVCKMGLEPTSVSTLGTPLVASPNSPLANGAGSSGSSAAVGAGAASITEVGPTGTILAPEDISFYAAILAMGCSTEADMVALAEHPEALELVPQLKEALILFGQRCDYRGAWALLQEAAFGVLEYDLFMAPHLAALQTMIREKAVASLWKAYERIELSVMANELGPGIVPSPESLRTLLVKLIRDGRMPNSRIDLSTNTIHRDPPISGKEKLTAKLERVTKATLDDTYSTLTRLSCLEHELVVPGSRRDGGARGRRGGRGGRGRSPDDPGFMEDAMMDEQDDAENDDGDIDMVVDDMNPEDRY